MSNDGKHISLQAIFCSFCVFMQYKMHTFSEYKIFVYRATNPPKCNINWVHTSSEVCTKPNAAVKWNNYSIPFSKLMVNLQSSASRSYYPGHNYL